jgi:hypothetical protein
LKCRLACRKSKCACCESAQKFFPMRCFFYFFLCRGRVVWSGVCLSVWVVLPLPPTCSCMESCVFGGEDFPKENRKPANGQQTLC